MDQNGRPGDGYKLGQQGQVRSSVSPGPRSRESVVADARVSMTYALTSHHVHPVQLALMPFRAEFLRSLKQIKNVYPLEWMRDWLQANTASKSRGAIDWAHLETVGYLLNRSTSKHLTKAQREDWVQLHHALGRYADPVYGTNSSDLRLMTVKRSRLTSAVIINSASMFPKIPMSSWILCRSRLPDARHSTLLWACVRKVDRLTRKLTVTVRSDVKARGYGGYSTNGELGLEPVDERELSGEHSRTMRRVWDTTELPDK